MNEDLRGECASLWWLVWLCCGYDCGGGGGGGEFWLKWWIYGEVGGGVLGFWVFCVCVWVFVGGG